MKKIFLLLLIAGLTIEASAQVQKTGTGNIETIKSLTVRSTGSKVININIWYLIREPHKGEKIAVVIDGLTGSVRSDDVLTIHTNLGKVVLTDPERLNEKRLVFDIPKGTYRNWLLTEKVNLIEYQQKASEINHISDKPDDPSYFIKNLNAIINKKQY